MNRDSKKRLCLVAKPNENRLVGWPQLHARMAQFPGMDLSQVTASDSMLKYLTI